MADTILAEYGRSLTIDFELWETDGTDLQTGAVHAAGDTVILRDEAAEANTTNGFVDEGTGYSIVLTAAEMEAARIKVYVVDQGSKVWLDKAIRVLTHSHPLAHDPRGVLTSDTAQAGTISSITLASGESATNDIFAGGVVEIIDGTGASQTPRVITTYDGTTKVASVSPDWVTAPDSTSVYRIFAVPPSASVQADVTQALTDFDAAKSAGVATVETNLTAILGTPAGADMSADIAAVQSDTDDIQTRLPASLSTAGNMPVDIQEIKENALTSTPPFDTV